MDSAPDLGVITATLTPPAKSTGLTHWSSRELAKKLKIGNATVARIWREHGIQPRRPEGFRFSTDPELEAKVIDVVGRYLDPPERFRPGRWRSDKVIL